MQKELEDALSRSWKSSCKVIFGQEIGELAEYSDYLKEAVVGKEVESVFSKKKLLVSNKHHGQGTRFFDFTTEAKELQLEKPLDIDSIKDIDSLIEGVRENLIYSGNKILGMSRSVEYSDSIIDSSFIYNSSIILGSKYIAYSYLMQYAEQVFGCTSSGQSANIIRCFYNNSLKRCFEMMATVNASDSLFSYNIWNCSDCLFSFNLRNSSHMIANVQLGKEKYAELKKKLLSEIVQELKDKKRLSYSIIDIVNKAVA